MISNLLRASAFANKLKSESGRLRSAWDINEQPVIGIVSQPLDNSLINDPRFEGYSTYIMAAYVEFLQGSGARVVPLISTEEWSIT
jgi:hypothetical protein